MLDAWRFLRCCPCPFGALCAFSLGCVPFALCGTRFCEANGHRALIFDWDAAVLDIASSAAALQGPTNGNH